MQAPRAIQIKNHRSFDTANIAPDAPFWAIGDVHGHYDLLAPLLDDLMKTQEQIVLLGDMINKGPQSAAVLRLVKQACDTGRVVALRGNHEDLLMRFIDRPRIETKHMLLYGGSATLDSFGVHGLSNDMALWEMSKIRNRLVEKMGDVADWLPTCPYVWQSGNTVALHAGADPSEGIAVQTAKLFAWGHPQFENHARKDGIWVVHGHRPVTDITVQAGRIAINTCAGATGKLTAVRISKGRIEAV